ncbi:MAG: hypothetical protein Fur0012_10150 [Elusimicrobiota bacterium]
MFIRKIQIKNFRSIKEDYFNVGDMTIVVGQNDSGKSNYLKALNLFFTGQTDFKQPFNFDIDFCKYTPKIVKKAQEIRIKITFDLPNNYKDKSVSWEKIWRKDGLYNEKFRDSKGKELSGKTKAKALLRKLKFRYVPAIKGNEYFSALLTELHDTLSGTLEEKFAHAGTAFIDKINEHTKDLVKDLKEGIKIDSKIQLPKNLRQLFSTLDFETIDDGHKISLQQRGDGIKTQYIPIILKFLAEQEKKNHTRGAIQSETIWGYEEPENNLEMGKAFDMAKTFSEYSSKIQIFITTHSPAFYSIKTGNNVKKSVYHLKLKQQLKAIEQEKKRTPELDNEMGFMPFVAPYIQEKQEEIKRLEDDVNALKSENEPTLFVEGLTDVSILEKAIEIYAPDFKGKIKIESECSAGYNYVMEKLKASIYSGKNIKMAGLFDYDEDANRAKKYVEDDSKYKKVKEDKLINIFSLRSYKPYHIIKFFNSGIEIPFSIEEIFPPKVWKYASKQGWLEDKQISSVKLPHDQSLLNYCKNKGITDDEIVYLKKIKVEKKREFVNYVCSLKGNKLTTAFAGFKKIISDLKSYYCPDTDTVPTQQKN